MMIKSLYAFFFNIFLLNAVPFLRGHRPFQEQLLAGVSRSSSGIQIHGFLFLFHSPRIGYKWGGQSVHVCCREHRALGLQAAVSARGGGFSRACISCLNMSYGSSSHASGAKATRRPFEFGRTHVVKPKGRHQATIVWLHGLGDNGASWSQRLETLPLPNIKWICPTAATRPVAAFGGFPCTAWFDVGDMSDDGPDDVEGLDASAAHVANLLSTEPADIKLGVGGFNMGAATALYSATCFTCGKYGNGKPYPVNLSAVVGLSGWLPCSRSLKNKLEGSREAVRQAASLPLLLCHGRGDEVVLYKHGEKSTDVLRSTGFRNLTFRAYNGLGHYTIPGEMDDVCNWLTASLWLNGSRA